MRRGDGSCGRMVMHNVLVRATQTTRKMAADYDGTCLNENLGVNVLKQRFSFKRIVSKKRNEKLASSAFSDSFCVLGSG